MKSLFLVLLVLVSVSCGNENKSGTKSTSLLSSDPLMPSTVDGYFYGNGLIEISGVIYQMVSSLSGAEISQKMVGVQPVIQNGYAKYRAHITGAIYNPCQQNSSYNAQLCSSSNTTKFLYVSAISFY